MNRRSMIGVIAALLGTVGGGVAALSTWVIGSSAGRRTGASRWIALCRVGDLETEPKKFRYAFSRWEGWYRQEVVRDVYAYKSGDAIHVLSRRCTHLGCAVLWNKNSESFRCPCHGAEFQRDGQVLSGPPPRPLDAVSHRVVSEVVEVEEG